MNENDVAQLLRKPFEDVRATTAVGAVVRRGRTLRRQRRLAWGATAAICAMGALAVTSLPHGAPVRLAAWTVAEQSHHVVVVTVSELRDPEGLQRMLRSKGVPATVRFTDQRPPSCMFYPGTPGQIFSLTKKIFYSPWAPDGATFAIDASAIPDGVGLWLTVSPVRTVTGNGGSSTETYTGSEALVYANGRCP